MSVANDRTNGMACNLDKDEMEELITTQVLNSIDCKLIPQEERERKRKKIGETNRKLTRDSSKTIFPRQKEF